MLRTFLISYSRSQRRGLIILFTIAFCLQAACFLINFESDEPTFVDHEWMAMDKYVDSAITAANRKKLPRKYPFNPNFITDYKGYALGMTVAEIDRLHAHREKGLYVNSASEFQNVTGVSDSLLNAISGQFKFPEWTQKKKTFVPFAKKAEKKIIKTDINLATKEELIKIYGVGPALSERILKFRESLGGFVHMDQIADVWGLSPEVVSEINKHFEVVGIQGVRKVKINTASIKELSAFPYFRYPISKEIVTYRSMNGPIRDVSDLAKIKNFPSDKIHIIAVYLEL